MQATGSPDQLGLASYVSVTTVVDTWPEMFTRVKMRREAMTVVFRRTLIVAPQGARGGR